MEIIYVHTSKLDLGELSGCGKTFDNDEQDCFKRFLRCEVFSFKELANSLGVVLDAFVEKEKSGASKNAQQIRLPEGTSLEFVVGDKLARKK